MKLLNELCRLVLIMSAQAVFMIGAVMLLRVFLKKLPRWVYCFLWLPVFIRLICPVNIPAGFGHKALSFITAVWLSGKHWITAVWICGCISFAAIYLLQYIKWKRKLACAVKTQDGCYESIHVRSPFVCGIVHPRIYLPCNIGERERELIVLHEQIHIRHRDPLIRMAVQAVLIVHWFNPFVWAAVLLFHQDTELFCDDAVIIRLGADARRDYSRDCHSWQPVH